MIATDDLQISQLKKLRRRIEEFLRCASPEDLLKVAKIFNIPIQRNLQRIFDQSPKTKE